MSSLDPSNPFPSHESSDHHFNLKRTFANYLDTKLQAEIKSNTYPPLFISLIWKAVSAYLKSIPDLSSEESEAFENQLAALNSQIAMLEKKTKKSYHRASKPLKTLQEIDRYNKRTIPRSLVPGKLKRELNRAQTHLYEINSYYGPQEKLEILYQRGPTSEPPDCTQLNTSALASTLPADDASVLGRVAVAHARGDRYSMEDTHLATVFTLNVAGKQLKIPLYGIFDGHAGVAASLYLTEELAASLQKRLELAFHSVKTPEEKEAAIFNILKKTFVFLSENYRMYHHRAGSTACVALIIEGRLWVANVGDTRAILNLNGVAVALSEDASLDTPEQRLTVEKRGGVVFPIQGINRVDGGLNMARSTCESNPHINSRAKITVIDLDILPPGSKFLCIACDGIFDILSSNQVAETLENYYQEGIEIDQMPANLVKKAYEAASSDNLSALIVDLSSLGQHETIA